MNYLSIIEFIFAATAMVAAVIFGILYAKRNSKDGIENEEKKAEDRLAVILKGTVELLEKKVDEQRKQLDENTEEIKRLSNENEIMTKIMQGRDDKSEKLYAMTEKNTENIGRLYTLLERHITLVEKALNITAVAQHQPAATM